MWVQNSSFWKGGMQCNDSLIFLLCPKPHLPLVPPFLGSGGALPSVVGLMEVLFRAVQDIGAHTGTTADRNANRPLQRPQCTEYFMGVNLFLPHVL